MPDTHHHDPFLEGLTPAQQQAVLHERGPLLVLAGPGSGKTRVITRRIARLMATGVPAWRILALTFTNKSAGEMRTRVGHLINDDPARRGLTLATFHSLCVRLLRRWSETAAGDGVPVPRPGFVVYDADDQQALMKKVLAELNLSTGNWSPRTVLGHISTAKNDLVSREQFTSDAADFYTRQIARAFEAYERALHTANACDFDDLLVLTARMLKESPSVRSQVQSRYRHLLVDEYQDTNHAQFVIAHLIAGDGTTGPPGTRPDAGPNICVVGDPDQSIYGWRGADITNILEFETHYPGARTIALGENFRSLPPILAAADRLISHNKERKHKPLISTRTDTRTDAAAPRVHAVRTRDEHHEASLVIDWLKERGDRAEWKDCALFFRTNALSRVLEERLLRERIPYILVRGTAFYDREEVRHALAYLRAVANPDDSISLGRIVNTPARGIGGTTLDRVQAEADRRAGTLMDALREAARPNGPLGLTARAAGSIQKFIDQLDSWRADAGLCQRALADGSVLLGDRAHTDTGSVRPVSVAQAAPPPEGALAQLVERIIRESGIERMYAGEDERLENLAEVVSSAREFEAAYAPEADPGAPADQSSPPAAPPTLAALLGAYLERVALVADTDALDPARGAVTLMTLHAAKGLEFKAVAIIGWEEGLLPHSRSFDSDHALEEERRLAFVGVTRAMDDLLITSAAYRTLRGIAERTIASRFLDELAGPGVRTTDHSDAAHWHTDDDAHAPHPDDDHHQPGARAGPRPAMPFAPGQRVRHPQFGPGTVESVSPGADARVRVKFPSIGVKTLVLAYARLERIG